MTNLGIRSVSFSGPTTLGRISVLGKGYVGVVILAKNSHNNNKQLLAVKIRRMDSSRTHMKHEASLLEIANKTGVGPKLYTFSKNFLVMKYINGQNIVNWLENLKGANTTARLKYVIRTVLTDCYRLDATSLDHGEISNITKHVIISANDKPVLIDFESASVNRRPSNVTSITQAIFISSPIAKKVQRIYKKNLPSKDTMISSLREYKNAPNKQTFDALLEKLEL